MVADEGGGIQCVKAMMAHRNGKRIRKEAIGMNRNATAALALLLASAATFGIWRLAWNGPLYARVISATPVTVDEPRYLDVLESVPVRNGVSEAPVAWDVAFRGQGRILHARLPVEPGDQVRVGDQRRIIGYDVAWRWREHRGIVRLPRKPGKRLPVVDGEVVAGRAGNPGG